MKIRILTLAAFLTFGVALSECTWLPLRVGNRSWLTVQEVRPGREFWLRPECRLLATDGRNCSSDWILSVRFWDWKSLDAASRALRKTGRCNSAALCSVLPYQIQSLIIEDQGLRWSMDKVLHVNGLLPSVARFRLRSDRVRQQKRSCSFDAENLVVRMMSSRKSLNETVEVRIAGINVMRAVQKLRESNPRLLQSIETGAVAEKISKTIVRQNFPDASPETAIRISNALENWAVWQGTRYYYGHASRRRNRTSAKVFYQFPLKSTFSVRTFFVSQQLFSLVDLRKEKMKSMRSLGQQMPIMKSTATMTDESDNDNTEQLLNLKVRIAQLEAIVTRLARNSTRITKDSARKIVSKLSGKRNSVYEIEECADVVRRRLKGSIFYLKPLKRRVRCSSKGELIILHRAANNVNFNRSMSEYRRGFGNATTGDYWLGLDYLANYTRSGDTCARISLVPWRLRTGPHIIQYADFVIAPPSKGFRLSYSSSKSDMATDALSEGRGQRFSTYDSDSDSYVGNCARIFGGGNWYRSCTGANIFGRKAVMSDRTMCWKGVDPSQGNMCSPLSSLYMSVKKTKEGSGGTKVLFSFIASNRTGPFSNGSSCISSAQDVNITSPGLYTVLAGGAPGGSKHSQGMGGRGATIRMKLFLTAGTLLRVAPGCRGGQGYSSGHGGDATWITDSIKKKLLLVAGGGGGGGINYPGTHGRATREGGSANEVKLVAYLTTRKILKEVGTRGLGWRDLKDRLLQPGNTTQVTSGVKTLTYKNYYDRRNYRRRSRVGYSESPGGGGGGGYEGGITGSVSRFGGGGGGSFCNEKSAKKCEIFEGGNFHNNGYVIILKQTCF